MPSDDLFPTCKELFIKYMRHIGEIEGVYYIDDHCGFCDVGKCLSVVDRMVLESIRRDAEEGQ